MINPTHHLLTIPAELRNKIYSYLIPSRKVVAVEKNGLLFFKRETSMGSWQPAGVDSGFRFSVFGVCQTLRRDLMPQMFAKNQLIFEDFRSVGRFLERLESSTSALVKEVHVQVDLNLARHYGTLAPGWPVLCKVLGEAKNLKDCVNLQALHISLMIKDCKEQSFIGDVLQVFAKEVWENIFDLDVTVTRCSDWDESRADLIGGLHENIPSHVQLLARFNYPQFWVWTLSSRTKVWSTERHLLHSGGRFAVQDFTEIIEHFKREASRDRASALQALNALGNDLRMKECVVCGNTCCSMRADLRWTRMHWCRNCELVFACGNCSQLTFQHPGCVRKPTYARTEAERHERDENVKRRLMSIQGPEDDPWITPLWYEDNCEGQTPHHSPPRSGPPASSGFTSVAQNLPDMRNQHDAVCSPPPGWRANEILRPTMLDEEGVDICESSLLDLARNL